MLKPPLNPMLLSSKEEPFDSKEFIFEIKWDGFRCLSFINESEIILQSRNKNNLIKYFPELNDINKSITSKSAILDGEICLLDNNGRPNFSQLQRRFKKQKLNSKKVNLIIWDILSYDNHEIYQRPLSERKKMLTKIVSDRNRILIPDYIEKYGKKLFTEVRTNNLEGIVAKKIDSPYEFKRSKFWYKIKAWQFTDTIIGGYNIDGDSLLVGKFINKEFTYMGRVKIGLAENMRTALFRYLPSIVIQKCPFSTKPSIKRIQWVRPVIKTTIRYTELSYHNNFRHGFATKIILN